MNTIKHFLNRSLLTKLFLFLILGISLISCENNKPIDQSEATEIPISTSEKDEILPYKILRTDPYESDAKAQLKCYAYLTTDSITKDLLTESLNNIFWNIRNYHKFENFSAPTVVAIYLFTSEDNASSADASWVAMLSKGPSDDQPRISFNEMKLKALVDAGDNQESNDERTLRNLKDYLTQRGTDLCIIYKTLDDLEGATIKQADMKYPDFGTDHLNYQSKLYKQEKKKLFRKHRINDTLGTYIIVFGMNYCK